MAEIVKIIVLAVLFGAFIAANRASARTTCAMLKTEETLRANEAALLGIGAINSAHFEHWMAVSRARERKLRTLLRTQRICGLEWRRNA